MADGLPIFFRDAEEKLMIALGRELTEGLINQHCVVYSISVDKTESNFYGESKNKIYNKMTEIIGRIQIADVDVVSEGGVRRVAKGDMNLWAYNEHLTEEGLVINVGDYVGYAGKFYEVYDAGINKDALDRKFAGDREYFTEVLAKAVSEDIFKSMEGNFE